ncbi:hypothetical protein SynBIOSE41_03470 [Synechococcus sp. BIOS-E4-1]|uniref:DUF3987 domain-containing protein n=1 Tax=Synechococcus sp. BIOS-E4-1 TaxID=1400864 RepID=UPI0016471B9C|nr:DUF3987 domain-containing protein [Synechococcus sp. BIOS-E4-1]QNI55943.1 hypothetical protein SynBIOSE41_03470 [Synechococcus sp. BIOS-E4-1]
MESPQIDIQAARHFLTLIGKNGDARFRAFPHKKTPPERKKQLGARKFGRSEANDAVKQAQSDGLGIYVVINTGGDTKSSITECVAYFAEFDGMTEEQQHSILFEQGLMPEPSAVVRTGGDSLHAYWLLSEPIADTEQWQDDMKRLAAYLGSDPSINDPSRVMRLPGCWYMDGEGKPVAQVTLIHESKARYSREEIISRLPEPAPTPTPTPTAAKAVSSNRSSQRALDRLCRIPPRKPGSNNRDKYLPLLWSLAHIIGPEQAGQQMTIHSPEWAKDEDLTAKAKEAKGEITDGTFFQLARDVWGVEAHSSEWIKEQLFECLRDGLDPGQMAVEVQNIAAQADVHVAAVEKILNGLCAADEDTEAAAEVFEVITLVDAAAKQVETIQLEQFLPSTITGALQTVQQGIHYKDLTLLMAQLAMTSSCLKLGTRINGNPFTDWEVPMNLFGIDVGPSGAQKSPLVKAIFTKPSEEIRHQLSRVNAERFESWELECKERKGPNKPPRPVALLHTTNDYTAEALADQLAAHEGNGMSLLVLRDEVAALFDSFGKYKQGGKGSGGDEQQLLEIFDGDGFNSIRCSKGRTYDHCHVSLYGGIQDDVLRRLIASGDANGKWARCIFLPLPEMTYRLPKFTAEKRQQRLEAERTLKSIATSLWQQAPRTYELDDDGIELLSDYAFQCQQLRNQSDLNAVKALKNKSPGKALRIAGLLHILHCQQNGQYLAQVPMQRLQEAILLIETLDDWTAAFHATARLEKGAANAIHNREKLLRRIHAIALKTKGPVTWKVIRDAMKGSEKKGITAAMAKVMLQQLHDMGIGQLSQGKRGGVAYRALTKFPD